MKKFKNRKGKMGLLVEERLSGRTITWLYL